MGPPRRDGGGGHGSRCHTRDRRASVHGTRVTARLATTALYLAHLNPVTNAHVEIISQLREGADRVKVMPVVFRDGPREINSRSFPFSFEARRSMLESVFGDSVWITDDYAFLAPFKRYMPPLLAPRSWRLRGQILRGVEGDFFSYTGDRAEGYMLRMYGLKPRVGRRRPLSAASVKEGMYRAALGRGEGDGGTGQSWKDGVPDGVAGVIEREWGTVRRYAGMDDATRRIAGMKFPTEGWGSSGGG